MREKKSRVNVDKKQVMVAGREEFAPQVKVEVNGNIVVLMSSFKYLRICLIKDGKPQEEMKMKVDEGLTILWCKHVKCQACLFDCEEGVV